MEAAGKKKAVAQWRDRAGILAGNESATALEEEGHLLQFPDPSLAFISAEADRLWSLGIAALG